MTEFKREERYLVLKLKDLSPGAAQHIREYVAARNLPNRQYVVVESDWPEYELVWAMIEARVTKNEPLMQAAALDLQTRLAIVDAMEDTHAERATIRALVEAIDRELMPHIARLPVQRLDTLNETLIAARKLLEGAE